MDILRRELTAFYASQHLERETLPGDVLASCRSRVESMVGVSNACAVVTDAAADRCWIYGGTFAAHIGVGPDRLGCELPSSDEDVIYANIHPEDIVEKRMLEYEFFRRVDTLPVSEKMHLKASCRLRISGADGTYRTVANSTQVLNLSPAGKIWLILCCYDLDSDPIYKGNIEARIVDNHSATTELLSFADARANVLSPREKEVLLLFRRGLASIQIAAALQISINTVNRHRQNILAKLSVANSVEAIVAAESMRLL